VFFVCVHRCVCVCVFVCVCVWARVGSGGVLSPLPHCQVDLNWALINSHFHAIVAARSETVGAHGSSVPCGAYGTITGIIPFWDVKPLMKATCAFAISALLYRWWCLAPLCASAFGIAALHCHFSICHHCSFLHCSQASLFILVTCRMVCSIIAAASWLLPLAATLPRSGLHNERAEQGGQAELLLRLPLPQHHRVHGVARFGPVRDVGRARGVLLGVLHGVGPQLAVSLPSRVAAVAPKLGNVLMEPAEPHGVAVFSFCDDRRGSLRGPNVF
jgi:hypothetical protein